MARTSAGRSAVSRAVEIIDVFGGESINLTATEIADRTKCPVPSTFRRLQELTDLGLLERLPDRSYRLGTRLWEWAARSPGAAGLRVAALPHLQRVHHFVRQHAQVGVLVGHDVLFVERLSAPDSVVNYSVIGQRLPALISSSGLAQIAFLQLDEQEITIEAAMNSLRPENAKFAEDVRSRLQTIRRVGYVVNDGFVHPAARGIAVPIRGGRQEVIGAVSVVVPNDDAPTMPKVHLLRHAAASIGQDYVRLTGGSGR